MRPGSSRVTFSRRRQVAVVFGFTSGALLGACAPFPGGAPAAQPTAKAKTPAALTLSHRWDGDLREPAVESQLRGFREAHPHLTVNVSVGRESALVTSAAGLSADVAMLHSNEAAPLAAGGALVTLDAHLIREGTKPEELYFPAGLTLSRLASTDKTFALPLTAS